MLKKWKKAKHKLVKTTPQTIDTDSGKNLYKFSMIKFCDRHRKNISSQTPASNDNTIKPYLKHIIIKNRIIIK